MFAPPTASRSAPPVRRRAPRRRLIRPALEELEKRSLLSAGALDLSFNGTGKELLDIEGDAHAVALQRGGKIVVAGFTGGGARTDMAVVQLNADGTLDPSFNGTGKQAIDFGGPFSGANAVAVQPDGRIVLAGTAGGPGGLPGDFAVARLNP